MQAPLRTPGLHCSRCRCLGGSNIKNKNITILRAQPLSGKPNPAAAGTTASFCLNYTIRGILMQLEIEQGTLRNSAGRRRDCRAA
ncbi:hypothetical protein BKA56DRAFT_582745 [Ilyonectria sp. MPI-CAGE-AT-0026]|nr:hypothetical protein BKA56DRAFT_582745 [Ilyonectria sp. MPI-CAGE-AT-0026]